MMKSLAICILCTLAASSAAAPAAAEAPGPASQTLALVGGVLLDGTGGPPVPDAAVVIRGGRIECAGSRAACPLPEGARTIDAAGRWITPGIVDSHVHFCQTGWLDGRPDFMDVRDRFPYEQVAAGLRGQPERFLRSYLCSGVTAVFDVGGYPWTWDLRGRAEADPLAPRVAASGPLLSTLDFWLNLPAERQFIYLADEKTARDGVSYLAASRADAVKIWFIPAQKRLPDEMAAVVRAAGEEARRHGLPLIVHATGLQEAKEALRAGARLLVHSVEDAPVDEEFLAAARANRTIYCPTLTVRDGYMAASEAALSGNAPALDDPNHCVDRVTAEHVAATAAFGSGKLDPEALASRRAAYATRKTHQTENLMRVVKAGIPVAMGTDAGNPLTLHGPSVYAEMEAMQAAGMTPMQVLVASTRTAAEAMGRAKDFGTIEKGKLADLLLLEADPAADIRNMRRLRTVVRGGEVHPVEALRAPGR